MSDKKLKSGGFLRLACQTGTVAYANPSSTFRLNRFYMSMHLGFLNIFNEMSSDFHIRCHYRSIDYDLLYWGQDTWYSGCMKSMLILCGWNKNSFLDIGDKRNFYSSYLHPQRSTMTMKRNLMWIQLPCYWFQRKCSLVRICKLTFYLQIGVEPEFIISTPMETLFHMYFISLIHTLVVK